jgi:hypothetical protein
MGQTMTSLIASLISEPSFRSCTFLITALSRHHEVAEPTPMGHEYCGIVEEVGSDVKLIKPG